MQESWGPMIYVALLVRAYLAKPAIVLAGFLYAYARRTVASFIIVAGLIIHMVSGIVDRRLIEQTVASGRAIDSVHSNAAHLASVFAEHLGFIVICVGVLIVAVQEVILRHRRKTHNDSAHGTGYARR